jgi:hypothetical protein
MLSLYRKLLKLRRSEPALSIGSIELLDTAPGVLAYIRRNGPSQLLMALNLMDEQRPFRVPDGTMSASPLLSTLEPSPFTGTLRANEGLILKLED